MTLWQQLYGIIWLAFLQIILIVLLDPAVYGEVILGLHVILGLAILGLAFMDNAQIKRTAAPDRLKRIVRSTASLATAQIVLGAFLYLAIAYSLGNVVELIIRFLHVGIALAIITQASSVATAYDMWEEHEYAPA